jgi:hypothetical protein
MVFISVYIINNSNVMLKPNACFSRNLAIERSYRKVKLDAASIYRTNALREKRK